MTSPCFDEPSTTIADYDVFVALPKAGHGVKGASIGSVKGQPQLFREDMLRFHAEALGA